MQRRTFLKKSALGIGTLAGFYSGVLKAEEVLSAQPSALSNGNGFADPGDHAWGTNAVVLKSPWSRPPSVEDLLADSEHTVAMSRFYRVAGEDLPATATECRIAYSSDALVILFRCQENDMSFPYANLDAHLWRSADWHSLPGLPSGSDNNWPPNPDEVDFLIQPDPSIPSYYQFAATPQGLKFGCNRLLGSASPGAADEAAARLAVLRSG